MKRASGSVSLQLVSVVRAGGSYCSAPRNHRKFALKQTNKTNFQFELLSQCITFGSRFSLSTVVIVVTVVTVAATCWQVCVFWRLSVMAPSGRIWRWGCAWRANMKDGDLWCWSGGVATGSSRMSRYVCLLSVFWLVALAAAGIMGDECDWTGR